MIQEWNWVKNLELNPRSLIWDKIRQKANWFWSRWELNPINLIQQLGTLPVKLTRTHMYKSNLNSLINEKIKQFKFISTENSLSPFSKINSLHSLDMLSFVYLFVSPPKYCTPALIFKRSYLLDLIFLINVNR